MGQLGIDLKIGAVLANTFQAAISNSTNKLARVGSTIRDINQKSAAITAFKKARTDVAAADLAFRNASDQADRLGRKMAGVEKPTKAMRSEFSRAQATAARLKKALDKKRGALSSARSEIKKAGLATSDLTGQERRLTDALEKQKRRRDDLNRANALRARRDELRGEARGQVGFVAAITAALAFPAAAAMKFESAMSDVKKVVNFETPEVFRKMGRQIREMSTRLPMAATGIANIVAEAGQAGIARAELTRFAKDATKMSVAFDMSAANAGAAMAMWRKALGLTQDEAVLLGDTVNHLSNNMNAKASGIVDIIRRQGAVARAAGLTDQQTAGLAAAMLSGGASSEVAATGLKNFTNALTKGSAATAKQKQAFAALGIDSEALALRMQTDAEGAIQMVLGELRNMPEHLRPALMSELFGEESKGAIAPLIANAELLTKGFNLAADQAAIAGSMTAEYEERAKTTANNVQLFKNNMVNLATVVGSVLLPPLNDLIGITNDVVGNIAHLAEDFPGVTKFVLGAVAAWGAYKVVNIAVKLIGGEILPVLDGTSTRLRRVRRDGLAAAFGLDMFAKRSRRVKGFRGFRKSVGGIGQTLKSIGSGILRFGRFIVPFLVTTMARIGIALVSNPVGAVVAAVVGALVGAVVLIRKYWEPISAWFGGVWEGIVEAFAPVGDEISAALEPFEPITRAIGDGFRWIGDGVSSLIGWFGDLLEPVKLTKSEFGEIENSGKSVGKVIGVVLKKAFELVTAPVRTLVGLIGTVVDGFRYILSLDIDKIFGGIMAKVSGFGSRIKSSLPDFMQWGNDDPEPARGAVARSVSPAPLAAASVGGGSAVTNNQTVRNTINVTQQPGEDSDGFVDRVADAISRRMRGGLFDD